MIGSLPSLSGSSPPSVRRPIIAVKTGGTSWRTIVTSLRIDSGLAPHADGSVIDAAAAYAPDAKPGDPIVIRAGYEDSGTAVVFTGEIDTIERTTRGLIRVMAINGGALLARHRPAISFEQRSAADIVRSLADEASVSVGSLERGATLPHVVCDGRASALDIVAAMALRSGLAAWIDASGSLQMKALGGGRAAVEFGFGVNILSAESMSHGPWPGAVRIIGEGASGSQGSAAASWIVKDPTSVTKESGSGSPRVVHRDAAVRTPEAAESLASAVADRAGRAQRSARFVVSGALEVGPGSLFKVDARSGPASLGGEWVAMRIEHTIDSTSGFRTTIHAVSGGESGLLGGLL